MKNNHFINLSYLDFEIKDKSKYISQMDYENKMLNQVEPYLNNIKRSGYIFGIGNLKLYYEKYIIKNPKANIVICHGLKEYTEKYNELIYYFLKEGYSVFIIEHRGHSNSTKLGIDDYQINVEKFNYYVEDFRTFIDNIVIPQGKNKSLLLFAHSMGGGIGSLFLEEYPEYFKAAVLSSPMHEINTGKIPKFIAILICLILKVLGRKNVYVPGKKPYSSENSFKLSATNCVERCKYNYEKIKSNKAYQNGGPSVNWYIESIKATRNLLKKKNAEKVKIPVLLFQSELDTYVMPKAHLKFSKHVSKCHIVHIKGSKHEGYCESDKITFAFVNKILLFYENNK